MSYERLHRDWRHMTGDPGFFQSLLIAAPDLWIFVLVLNQRSAFLDIDINPIFLAFGRDVEACREEPASRSDRDLTRRLVAHVKVLMKPAARRTVHAALAPLHLYDFTGAAALIGSGPRFLWPQEDVAFGLQDQQNGPWAMIMGLVIPAHRPFRHVANETVA